MDLHELLKNLEHPTEDTGAENKPVPHIPEIDVTDEYVELKANIHDRLAKVIDLSLLDDIEEVRLRREINKATESILADKTLATIPLNAKELAHLLKEILITYKAQPLSILSEK